jgi:hypothetical protein
VGMVALIVVMVGRYAQSTAKIRAVAPQSLPVLDETALAKHVAAYLGTVLREPVEPVEVVEPPPPHVSPVTI